MGHYSHLRNKQQWELEQGLERWREVAGRRVKTRIAPWAGQYVAAYEEELLVRRLLKWAAKGGGEVEQ